MNIYFTTLIVFLNKRLFVVQVKRWRLGDRNSSVQGRTINSGSEDTVGRRTNHRREVQELLLHLHRGSEEKEEDDHGQVRLY